jgi:8-oxo-dGTP pyrophosphatase MutT (NUDIX family)
VDTGETLVEALERELYEELHARAQVGKITHIHDRLRPGKARVEHFFLIENPEDFWDVDFSGASHEFELLDRKWCPVDLVDVDIRPTFLSEDLLVIDAMNGSYRVSDER